MTQGRQKTDECDRVEREHKHAAPTPPGVPKSSHGVAVGRTLSVHAAESATSISPLWNRTR